MNYAGKFDAAISLDGQGSLPPAYPHVDTFTAKAHGHVPEGAFVVPDPNLIFHGEFRRAGADLVLSHDGHEFVVQDYFRGDKRAAISSPDGAHLNGDIVNALTGHVQYAQAAPGAAAAAQVIGHVTKLSGSATAVRNGVSIILNNGDNVEKGDVVSTGSDSTLGITFIDGTVFGLSSSARMVLNEMVYDPNGSSNSSLLSLVAGTITFVAGETAKHGDMKIDTPVATMGIRGTAVLTQINFVIPAGGGDPQPQASFQVLVEPNGTTGSYILFDKVTLLPIATVNQAGQMIQISGGNVTIGNGLLSPEVQKLITDVFTLKFTDNNSNTKLTTNFTDSITQTSDGLLIKTPSGAVAIPIFVNLNQQGSQGPGTTLPSSNRLPGPPESRSLDLNGNVKTAFTLTERADKTGDTADSVTVSGRITFVDGNLGDLPTVQVNLADAPNYVYKTAGQQDVTGSLTDLQKQDIAATQIKIGVVADGGNNNNGSAVWTYTIPDHVFDFLAAGETLTLTYMVRVDNNFAVSPETSFIPITITITGTNDKPTVATSGGTVIEKVGTGNTALDTITGAVAFTDVDLTDRPIVSAALSSTQPFKYLDAHGHDITASLTPEQLAAIAAVEVPLTVVQGAGNSNNGSATWAYSVSDHLFDFLADGETLVLNYVVQVDDGHGGVVSTPIAVSINGADVSVEGTNDVPTIVVASTTATGAVKEDAAATLLAGGTITFNDPDLTDTHTSSFVLKSTVSSAHLPGFSDGASHIGTFALTAVSESPGASTIGSVGWNFTLDDNDPVLQSLAEGQTITQVYTVTIDDHHGGTVTQDVTVVITGKNDAPTITSSAAAATGKVTEDAATPTLSIDGTVAIRDLDLIDTHTAQAVFKSSASSAHLPGFADGTTNIGTFTIDPSVAESNSDTDNGATLGWHFTLNDNDPVLQSLAEGQTITQVYTVTLTDNNHASVTQDVTVTITGTNDAPTVTSSAVAATGKVTEDAATPTLSIDGTLAIQDLDLIDTHTAQAVFKSSTSSADLPGFVDDATNIGTFTIDPSVTELGTDTDNGATLGWHFTLDNSNAMLQSLAEGQTITQVYTVTFTDSHNASVTQDVTVTINGVNDAPTITSDAAAAKGAVTEDAATPTLSADGTLAIQDLDLIDTHMAQAVFKSSSASADLPGFDSNSPIGTFTIDPSVTECNSDTDNGATLGWHFTLDDSNPVLQSLAEGQSITQVYTVTFTDSHNASVTQDVTVTINGANDAPTISNVTSTYMNFDGQTIAVGDVPTGASDGVTLDGWVNWNGAADPGASQVLFYNGNTSTTGFGLMGTVNVDGTLELEILAGGVEIEDTGVALTASQWHNLALTRENGTFTLYLDGNAVHSQTWGINSIDGNPSELSYMMIGAASDRYAPQFGAQGFTGSIADVSVWTAALTQTQIQSINFTALTGSEANLAGYYQLSDGSGITATDKANPAQSLTIDGHADWANGTSGPGGAVADLMETNGGQLAHGVLAVSDVDAIDHVTVALDHVAVYLDGTLQTDGIGGLTSADLLNYLTVPSGDILNGTATHAQFTWEFNSGSQAFDFLAAGQTLSLQYTIVPDDGHTPTGTGNGVVTINIAGSNDAPTLDATTLASVSGDDSDPAGTSVADLFAGKFHDVDDGASFKAVAISADNACSDQGVWQYEITGTDQWVDIAGVSDTSALVLSTDTLIRFVPTEGFTGTPGALEMHALDNTYAGAITTTTSPATMDITDAGLGHGGTTPVSDQAASVGIDVTVPPDVLVANDDAISNAAPPSVDVGWVLDTENGHYYRIVASEVTWDQANANAIGDRAYLATVTSQHESDFIANLPGWDDVRYGVWSGGQSLDDDLQSSSHWTWVTGPEAGSDFTYTAWRDGEPSGWGSDTVGYMVVEDRGADWNDVPPYFDNRAYIEEWGGQDGQVAFRENTGATLTTTQLLANDTDSAGNPMTVTSVGDLSAHSAHGGTVALNGNVITYTPATDYFGPDSFTYTISDGVKTSTATVSFAVDQVGGPVINTEHFQVEHIRENSNEIITDLVVTDTDSGAATDTFTVTLSTAHPHLSSVSVYPTSGSLDQINTGLASGAGIAYDPTGATSDSQAELPATDQITLTIADSAGHYDTVNFIFAEGANSQGISLAGAGGKDVIFATESSDTLIGGGAKDQFVFAPTSSQDAVQHNVNDFEIGLDKIDLRQFTSITSWTQVSALAEQQGVDTVLNLDNNDKILLKNTVAGNLHASDFILHVS